ncbi:ShlB/FhaC/HecB family hemolysin secretion/activation protein, partial [Leptolyngbya cf. ectocarpi LEGE 11479]
PDTPPSETVTIANIQFTDNTVFSAEELLNSPLTTYAGCNPEGFLVTDTLLDTTAEDASSTQLPCPPLFSILDTTLSAPQLFQVANDVAGFYSSQGYTTTGAVIDVSGTPEAAILTIQIVEDQLEDNIRFNDSRLTGYVQERVGVTKDKVLNVDHLQDNLRLLQVDPLIDRISASLTTGSRPGRSLLDIEIDDAPTFNFPLGLNNSRSPSVGSFQQQVTFRNTHVLSIGDTFDLGYTRSDGSDSYSANYTAILSPKNDTFSLNYSYTENEIIEPLFNRLDIRSASESYGLVYRLPLSRSVDLIEKTISRPVVSDDDQQSDTTAESVTATRILPTYEEFALTLGAQLRDSGSSLLGIPFQFSDGADASGDTRSFVMSFGQEWTRQNALQVFSLRSKFSLGIGAFGANISPTNFPVVVPDSRFLAWRGQGQWVRLVDGRNPDFLFVLRGDIQLSDDPLLSSEKFSLGGPNTVRGYRQDSLVTDNGLLLSAELLLPILQDQKYNAVFQVIPFVDYGVGWNTSGVDPVQSVRSSFGLGFQWTQGDLRARLNLGFPLVDVASGDRTWQENGIHFSVQYNPSF